MTNYAVWLVIKFEFWDKFMSKIPHKGPGGRDGEGDCFGRLFGEFLPFVW